MGKYQTSAGEVSSGSKDINTIATRHPTINGHLYRVNRLTGAGHYPFYVSINVYRNRCSSPGLPARPTVSRCQQGSLPGYGDLKGE